MNPLCPKFNSNQQVLRKIRDLIFEILLYEIVTFWLNSICPSIYTSVHLSITSKRISPLTQMHSEC